MDRNKLWKFCRDNKIILIAFILSTVWFFIQHASGLSWDFSVYVLNGRYLLWGGHYFDWNPAPIVPMMLGLLQPFGLLSEYLFILIVSLVWLAVCLRFADRFGLNRTALYVLAVNPAVLLFGLRNGTELLATAFIVLFFTEWFAKRKAKGVLALAGAVLIRYPSMIFAPLLLTKDVKRLLIGIVLAACLFAPWLAFNWITSGNPFASIESSYAMNALQNEYVRPIINVPELLMFINFIIPFAVVGIIIRFKAAKRSDWFMLVAMGLMILAFATIATKDVRYMFAMTAPAIYFGEAVVRRARPYVLWLLLVLSVVLAISATIAISELRPELPYLYESAAADADNCGHASNAWIFMNYLGVPSEPPPRMEQAGQKLDAGYRIILFKNYPEPGWQTNESFMAGVPVLTEKEGYLILGYEEKCAEPPVVNSTYLEMLNEWLAATGRPEYDPCMKVLPKALCNMFPINIE